MGDDKQMMTHPLLPKLRQLKLSGMLNTLELRAEQAALENLSPVEFFALLLDDEVERREQQLFSRRLKLSGCDPQKTLTHFDFTINPSVSRSYLTDLASCAFLSRHENILFCGPSGVGKSHMANAIGVEALKRGFRVISKSAYRLLSDLNAARASGAYLRVLSTILNCDLLILDDFGLQSLPPACIQDLYEIICERYERHSMIVTSNRDFSEWADVFQNDLLSSAALDRLTHHAHSLTVTGNSYRQLSRRKEDLQKSKSGL
jgi:DNA replication protein DnaC